MSKIHSKVSAFSLNGQDLTPFVNTAGISISVDAVETTPIGTSYKTYLSGLQDATLSVSGFYSTATIGPEAAFKACISLAAAVPFAYRPAGQATGYQGNALVTSYEVSSPVGDYVAFTGELQVTGGASID